MLYKYIVSNEWIKLFPHAKHCQIIQLKKITYIKVNKYDVMDALDFID